jgi:hypothetical protein
MPAGEVDFTDDALANPRFVGGLGNLADEFVAGGAGESVVAALQLEVGGADAGGKQANAGETFGNARKGLLADLDACGATSMTSLEMNS